MAGSIIEVKNISKRFILNHEGGERYTALRDVVAQKLKKTFSFPASLRGTKETKEEFWALKDVSFNVEQGDRVGIIGRNGAGKSTLLKILSRITEPTSGEIRIKGRVASLLEVGTGFHPELTGRENIFLNGAILGMSRAEIKRKFDEIVDFAEVEKFLDTPVKRYSSGMYVRLAFAVAAHLEPEILIVDEVLAVGDAQFQKKCLGKMQDVSDNEGRTVLFVSHNMGAIVQLCTTGILLENGKINICDSINKVVNVYSSNKLNNGPVFYKNEKDNKFIRSINIESSFESSGISASKPLNILIRLAENAELPRDSCYLGIALLDKWKKKIFTAFKPLIILNDLQNIRVKLPANLLLNDFYSIDCAVFIPNGNVYEYLHDICQFEVESFDSEFAILNNADIGVVNILCDWS